MSPQREVITIPGYDWDPVTRRYYRQNAIGLELRSLSSTSEHQNESSNTRKRKKTLPNSPGRNFLDLLTKRQNGFLSGNFEHQATSLKWKNFKLSISKSMPFDLDFDDIYLLKRYGESLFGAWKGIFSSIIEIDSSSMKTIPIYHETENITDFCETISSETPIMYIVNIPGSPRGVAMTERGYLGNLPKSPIWCCGSNKFSERYALGVGGAVAIADATKILFTYKTSKNVHAVAFNQIGNLFCAGLHNGSIRVVDQRTLLQNFEVNLYNKGIDEIVFLHNENYLICGSFGGKLGKVDTRMFKIVSEYHGHRHGAGKTPFTVDESANLMCATGSDNKIRLWSLNGGSPIKTILPPLEGIFARAALHCKGSKCVVQLFQKHKQYIYEV